MKKSILASTSASIERAFALVHAALDVAQVPDNHPIRVRVASAFGDLEDALKKLPKNGRNASAVLDPAPAVYVVPERDMRNWPTTDGTTALEAVMPRSRRASRIANRGAKLTAPRKVTDSGRRVVSSKEFISLVRDAAPESDPYDLD